MDPDALIEWRLEHERRLTSNESAINTLASAAQRQQEFNERVIVFMASVRTWGIVMMMIYALGQALLIARLT
jgi:uncharacterized membrane protein YecN with MAPEG domain